MSNTGMSFQAHTPNKLMYLQRHMDCRMEFRRTAHGNPYFVFQGRSVRWTKKDGYLLYGQDRRPAGKTRDLWEALAYMRGAQA